MIEEDDVRQDESALGPNEIPAKDPSTDAGGDALDRPGTDTGLVVREPRTGHDKQSAVEKLRRDEIGDSDDAS